MKIRSIRSVRLPLPLCNPLKTSHGVHANRVVSLVEVVTTDDVVGWGEDVAPSGVTYVGESPHESFESLRLLSGLVAQRTIDVREMYADSWWGVSGRLYAKHALESALWDAATRTAGVSLSSVLGGVRTTVTPGVVVGVAGSLDELTSEIQQRVVEGYRRIKLKIEPGQDIQVVRCAREIVGENFLLQVDANGAYGADDLPHLSALDDFGLQFIEQPFAASDVETHAQLAREISTPICLDESVVSIDDLIRSIEMGACSVLNIKPSRVGGISDAVRLVKVAESQGIDAWVGGMLETGIGRASCLALASLPGFTLTPDLSASQRYFDRDVTEPFELVDGDIAIPAGPGIGVTPLPWVFQHPDVKIETLFSR